MFEAVVDRFVRRNLRGVWVRGEPLPGPAVWAANHHGWWDPFVVTAASRAVGSRSAVLMQQDNLDRFRFARAIGAFGTGELRRGLRYLAEGRVLIVFPEGSLHPPGPPRPLAKGAAWFAAAARAPLVAVASRIVMRGQQAPEAYLSFSPGEADLWTRLATDLSELDSLLASADPRAALPGFTLAVRGRRSYDERIASMAGSLPWRR